MLVVIGPRIQAWAKKRAEAAGRSAEHVTPARMAALVAGTFAVGVYGGYFTAAQGILLIAVMGALLPEDMQRMNAAKNLLSLLVNVVAAAAYILVAFDRISWEAAGLIAVGSLIGGFLGAHYGRRLSPIAYLLLVFRDYFPPACPCRTNYSRMLPALRRALRNRPILMPAQGLQLTVALHAAVNRSLATRRTAPSDPRPRRCSFGCAAGNRETLFE